MYLKSLEIQGFKSFPEKTRLTFDKPVTAIVGPNGSGKSNISDALLWVMGEQSTRTLRGGKMEDVIFGGTARRPQLGFAEVSLVLDNTDRAFDLDYTEVMITRRYYRSGESEYFINRKLVRLKDLSELLMDTGLGREGYSVIGQGKIDAILSAKSTDRREIFEEAAGISRYRHRKEESERKLEQTEDNLVRINDKISELALQVEPLRAQAEVAKKYLVLRDEQRGLEISVWMETLDTLQSQAKKQEADYLASTDQKNALSREIESWYKTTEAFTERMHDKDRELERIREDMSAVETKSHDLDSAVALLRSKLENNINETSRIRRELSEQEGRDGGLKAQIGERETRLEAITGEKDALAAGTEALYGELRKLAETAGEGAKRLGALVAAENETVSAISEAKVRRSALASSLQEMYDRESAVKLDIASASDKLAAVKADRAAGLEALGKAKEELASLKNVISGYAMRLESRKKKAEDLGEKKIKADMALAALRSRIHLLTEMEKDYQGYSKAVKLVMQEASRGSLRRIHGTVAGLVKTDDKYTVAIETALGAAMQNIIVDTEEDGKAAINYLKRHDGGRATFLPISAVRGNVLDTRDLKTEDGYEGLALELVRFDDRYTGIYRSLLGRTAVAETLDDAIKIARRHNNSFRIVTLDGQVMNAGGSMTGGSATTNSGILSRANELKQLEGQEKRLMDDVLRYDRELSDAAREKNAAEYELETAGEEKRTLENRLLKLEADDSHSALLISAAEESIGTLKAEADTLAERIQKNGGRTGDTQKEIKALEEKLAAIRSDIEKDTKGQDILQDEREKMTLRLSENRAKEASLDAEAEALKKAVTELAALRDVLTGGRQQQMDYLGELKTKNAEILKEISSGETALVKVGERAESLRQRAAAVSTEKLELEGEREKRNRQLQDKNQELLSLERECARLEQKMLASNLEEKQLIDKLWDTYEMTRTTAMEIRKPLHSLSEARQRIAELKRELSALGSPNIGAIEEFERVNERYTYLTDQRDDVEKAKNDLLAIIRDITQEMKSLFSREFESIRKSFSETFLEFFGGGQASLELEDPEDILNCGIEIRVQPPGKSLKTLTLLSGGEKAFVAIALYFAILKVRPTPFVVMDEIEAALDEANVLRFAENMRRMSVRTQMLVITHHRGTMEEADVIYGVTMQEQGVSRVLCIDLDEAERSLNTKHESA